MSLSAIHPFGSAAVLLAALIIFEVPSQSHGQQSLRRPDLIALPPHPVGGKHVRAVQLIDIPEATSGNAQAAIASDQSIYVAVKAWNQTDNEESLWLFRLDRSGEKLWEKRIARQENGEEMRIVGLRRGTRSNAGLRVVYRQGLETRLAFFKSSGDPTLEETVGALESTQCLVAADSDYTLLLGHSMSVQDQPSHGWVARMTRLGSVLWKHQLAPDAALEFAEAPAAPGRMNITLPMDGIFLEDGSVVLVGQTGVYNKFGQGPSKLWLMRLDASGKKLAETFIDDGRLFGSGCQFIAKSGDEIIVPYTTDELPPISGAPYAFPPKFSMNLARYDAQLNQLWDKPLTTTAMPGAATITGPAPFLTLTAMSDHLLIRALDENANELWSSHVATPDSYVSPLAIIRTDDEIIAVCNYRAHGWKLEQQVLLVYVNPPN